MGEATPVALISRMLRGRDVVRAASIRATVLARALGACTLLSFPWSVRAAAQSRPTVIAARACTDGAPSPARDAGAAPTLAWKEGSVAWARWPVLLGAALVPVDLIVVRLDPSRVALSLEVAREGTRVRPWTIDDTPADAVVAFNAGQFTDEGPWGWIVHRGRERQPPGSGALAAAIVVDSLARVRIVSADSIAAVRARGVTEAVQSYPALLGNGVPPRALCTPDAIDRAHRDIRFVMGTRASGEVLLVLSRYRAPTARRAAERLPIGPTTLEMVEIMRRLGATDAVMLDGGLSAQLRVNVPDGGSGIESRWAGLRGVPLAFVGRARGR